MTFVSRKHQESHLRYVLNQPTGPLPDSIRKMLDAEWGTEGKAQQAAAVYQTAAQPAPAVAPVQQPTPTVEPVFDFSKVTVSVTSRNELEFHNVFPGTDITVRCSGTRSLVMAAALCGAFPNAKIDANTIKKLAAGFSDRSRPVAVKLASAILK